MGVALAHELLHVACIGLDDGDVLLHTRIVLELIADRDAERIRECQPGDNCLTEAKDATFFVATLGRQFTGRVVVLVPVLMTECLPVRKPT
eukprot:CAMPEP_0194780854 /NCGR_PEP_ID=MMETSP0323_2-20130528/74676_1 /TAXON_ID=2866 ORGANISM="Crypthecodinium cohnii, Strain Seligo" /NCGR_SAMPLE_ID=MMETSP0323_2 /ASSEMBLY_ACC=CAM_ASM_000346 /LENGTH=90 /DNA_ID=CAMNT_0039718993 /DNA_START=13 /DNA_END=281 /DNA_ORIENTATION=-